jgi:hypothetical protein
MSVFRKDKILIFMATIIVLALAITLGFARNKDGRVVKGPGVITQLNKPTEPVTFNSTASNLWVKLSNYGFIGDDAFDNPSFEWPGGSNNHHLYQGSIWVAGKDPGGTIHCTAPDEEEITLTLTDPNDIIYVYGDDEPDGRNRFVNRPNVDETFFAGSNVSDEDTYAEFVDLDEGRHSTGDSPLGIKVIERTYKWTASYNDDFIIWDYQIINIGLDSDQEAPWVGDEPQDLTEVYVAIRFDADVAFLGGGEYWYDDLTAYYAPKQISYLYDGDDPDVAGNDVGEYGVCPGYIYARLLKSEGPDPDNPGQNISRPIPVSHSWWTIDDDPSSDALKFRYMSTPNFAGIPASPYDYRFLQTVGPFDLPSGDTINVVWAMGVGAGLDNVIRDTDWAARIFNAGFLAATAPTAPVLDVDQGDGYITLSWRRSVSEESTDPLTGEQDFEGYRLYKSRRNDDAGSAIWVKLADYDKVNAIGANKGLQYEFTDRDIIPGYGYTYAITAYDRGAPEEGLGILESSKTAAVSNQLVVASGTVKSTVDEIYVYPNPFVGSAEWDHEYTFLEQWRRKLVFANLPGECTISIFTLAGDLVDSFETLEGEALAEWDMISRSEQNIAAGIYLYTVESDVGTHIGKFVVIQ